MTSVSRFAFGMAPPKPGTQRERIEAVSYLLELIEGDTEPYALPSRLAQLSEVKGLFNRVWREDQWDWFSVKGQLGYLTHGRAKAIGGAVAVLRSAIRDGHGETITAAMSELRRLDAASCLAAFVGRPGEVREPGRGWLYILSTREANTILKIGMTTRTVEERVREINGSTGVLVRYGVWKCWRVDDPAGCERRVHAALAEYRIRPDREFFEVTIGVAVTAVIRCLKEMAEARRRERGRQHRSVPVAVFARIKPKAA